MKRSQVVYAVQCATIDPWLPDGDVRITNDLMAYTSSLTRDYYTSRVEAERAAKAMNRHTVHAGEWSIWYVQAYTCTIGPIHR